MLAVTRMSHGPGSITSEIRDADLGVGWPVRDENDQVDASMASGWDEDPIMTQEGCQAANPLAPRVHVG